MPEDHKNARKPPLLTTESAVCISSWILNDGAMLGIAVQGRSCEFPWGRRDSTATALINGLGAHQGLRDLDIRRIRN